jgi:hypothetical protein
MRPERILLLLLVLHPVAAHADWVVNDRGDCVRAWTPSSLARGPAAIANAPLLPFRSAVGGAQVASEDRSPGLGRKIILIPLLTAGGAVMGILESAIWLTTGLADTLTGGYFEIAPDEATQLSLAPQRPPFLTEPVREARATTDPCGRPTR